MRGLPVAVALVLALPAPALATAPQDLFVYGDSLATGTKPFLPAELPGWRVEQNVFPNRGARNAAAALKRHRGGSVVHLSLGTIDDPARPERFRVWVRRAMRAAGSRCVVWANIWRPARRPADPKWTVLNRVLDEEAARRRNLVVADWRSLVSRNRKWLSPIDNTHVDDHGYRARARLVADAVRACHARLAPGARRSP